MTGLRVYTKLARDEMVTLDSVFYSRRGGGPIYRWRYEKSLEHWCSLRVDTHEVSSSQLRLATWKSVPAKLQAKLGEHYLD